MLYLPPERALELARLRRQQMIDAAERDRAARELGVGVVGTPGRTLAALVKRLFPGAWQRGARRPLNARAPCEMAEHAAGRSSV